MKPDLCKMFGKEVNEEFRLSGIDGTLKVNEDNKLMFFADGKVLNKWIPFVEQLNITAQREVVDIPWVPKKSECYFYVRTDFNVTETRNYHCEDDVSRIKLGNYFRTSEEAFEKGFPLMEQWKKELGW